MEVLRNLFGNLTTGIIRLVVGVGILAAAYFFIVKPVLNTTEKISHEVNSSEIFRHQTVDVGKEIKKAMSQVNKAIEGSVGPNLTATEAHQVTRTFKVVKHGGNPRRVIKCIQHANGDVAKIQRCAVKF